MVRSMTRVASVTGGALRSLLCQAHVTVTSATTATSFTGTTSARVAVSQSGWLRIKCDLNNKLLNLHGDKCDSSLNSGHTDAEPIAKENSAMAQLKNAMLLLKFRFKKFSREYS